VYGVFEFQAQVETLRGTLGKLGFSASEMTVLEGQSGIRTLDLSGEQGGLAKRVLRFEERLTDERREIGKYIQALARGRWVVLVNMPHDDTETKERLHRAFQQHRLLRPPAQRGTQGLSRPLIRKDRSARRAVISASNKKSRRYWIQGRYQ